MEELVEGIEGGATQTGFLPRPADGEDNFCSLAPRRDEFRNDFRRILQIGIHGNHGVAFPGRGFIQARGQRALKAKVARQTREA